MTDAPVARLVLDGSRCDGRGICALCCPERISLDQWGFARVDSEPIGRDAVLTRARRAVAACPEGALSLTYAHPPTSAPGGGFAPTLAAESRSRARGTRTMRWRFSGRLVR